MMTLEEVKDRLRRWAVAVSGGRRGKFLGLPGHCPYLTLSIKSTAHSGPDIPEQEWETDRKVRELGDQDMQLRTVIEMAYLGGGLIQDRATTMGFSRSTYFRRLDEAHHALLALFNASLKTKKSAQK